MVGPETWNARVLDLVQALWGSVSANFRMVTLTHDSAEWVVRIVLEKEDEDDREEIDEIVSSFDALQSTNVPRRIEVVIDAMPLAWPLPPERVVFCRREADDP